MTGRLAERTAALFTERYGNEPEGVWRAPGRVNLIGEHTDYNDGFALPFAIEAGVYVAAARRGDGILALTSAQYGTVVLEAPVAGLSPGEPGALGGWAAYPAGVAWALCSAGYRPGGASLAIDADLPAGAGLSSSAALECATGLAVAELFGLSVPAAELAGLARRAENEFVGAPTGLMDQLAVMMSQPGHVLLLDCRDATTTLVPFDAAAAGLTLLIIDTGVHHALTDGGYAQRRQSCAQAAQAIGLASLRDAGTGALASLTDQLLRRRARHVITENDRVLRTVALLRAGRLDQVGPLLTASHESLRDDYEVSWPEADVTVAVALRAGALGARMTGGGFGGSVIALIPVAAVGAVTAAVRAAYVSRGWHPPVITAALPSAAACRVR